MKLKCNCSDDAIVHINVTDNENLNITSIFCSKCSRAVLRETYERAVEAWLNGENDMEDFENV